jgi:hypothetical protein
MTNLEYDVLVYGSEMRDKATQNVYIFVSIFSAKYSNVQALSKS